MRRASLALLFLFAGCVVCPPRYEYKSSGVPSWIYELPKEPGWVYVWGSAGHSLSLKESRRIAEENGKKLLAYFRGVKVSHRSKKWEIFAPLKTVRLIPKVDWKTLSCEVVDEWFDPEGKAGLGYQYFVLLRMKR